MNINFPLTFYHLKLSYYYRGQEEQSIKELRYLEESIIL